MSTFYKKRVLSAFERMHWGRLKLCLPKGEVVYFGTEAATTAEMIINDERCFADWMLKSDIGLGETYVEGLWSSQEPEKVIAFFLRNYATIEESRYPILTSMVRTSLKLKEWMTHYFKRNTTHQSRKNISRHYDLGNEFYAYFLDPSMTYSSGWFASPEQTLEDAQNEKHDRLCRKLGLKASHHVLEIGCGWGGFAIHAAVYYQCKVTALTLSQAQYDYVYARILSLGLEGQVQVLLKDYRELEGSFDRIVSIEMLEAVGHGFLKPYFRKCACLLKEAGILGLQVILCADHRYATYRREIDWIRKHVFPGGHLPSFNAIQSSISKRSKMCLQHFESFGLHYARTLKEWRKRFLENFEKIRLLGFDDAFKRKWELYLAYCEAAFKERHINVAQLIYSRSNDRSYGYELYNDPAHLTAHCYQQSVQ